MQDSKNKGHFQVFAIDERATQRRGNLKTKTRKTKPNSSMEKVGGLGHHVREYGMTPRRYILGSWPILNIKLTSHKNDNRDIMTLLWSSWGEGEPND